LNLWRNESYRAYFDHLDQAGGFFYERWGDAPVHSIAASLFLPKDQIHFFNDIGYFHVIPPLFPPVSLYFPYLSFVGWDGINGRCPSTTVQQKKSSD